MLGEPHWFRCFRLFLIVSAAPLKKMFSLNDPCGPPSALAPLSDTVIISVLSSWPISSRNAISSPM